jgi:KaiC/GvpD/RAD55 family RecA-like ATPase
MKTKKHTLDPYKLDPKFEAAMVTMVCSRPKFYAKIGAHLDVDLLGLDAAKLALKAARSYEKENNSAPSSLKTIAQRLRSWVYKGEIKDSEVEAVMDLFDSAEEDLPDEEDIINEMRPILQHRIHDAVVTTAMDQFGKFGDMSSVKDMITKAERIGLSHTSSGTDITSDEAFDEITKLKNLVRIPTGIYELDFELAGGLERGSLWAFLGDTGDGKSIGLTQIAANGWIEGLFVIVVSLELDKSWWLARTMANVTGISIESVVNGSFDKTKAILRDLSKNFGRLNIEYMTPEATTFDDIVALVEQAEEKQNRKIDMLIVDYADLLVLSDKQATNNEYINMKKVWRRFRTWVNNKQIFGVTASQPRRPSERGKKKRLNISDFADSQNKARIVDGAIALSVTGEGNERQISFDIIKNRNGPAQIHVGPLPTQFEIGRIAPVTRSYETPITTTKKKQPELKLVSNG